RWLAPPRPPRRRRAAALVVMGNGTSSKRSHWGGARDSIPIVRVVGHLSRRNREDRRLLADLSQSSAVGRSPATNVATSRADLAASVSAVTTITSRDVPALAADIQPSGP